MCSPCGSGPDDAGSLHGHRLLYVLVFGMPPEHDHAMLGPQLQGSNPLVRNVHVPTSQPSSSGFQDGSSRSRSLPARFPTRFGPRAAVVTISVGIGAVSATGPVPPTLGNAHSEFRRLGQESSWVDHQSGVRTQRFRLEAGGPIRPADRGSSWRRPASGHGRHGRATDRRRRARGWSNSGRVPSVRDVSVGYSAFWHRSGRPHRTAPPIAATSVGSSLSPADRPPSTDPATACRHPVHQHPAHHV